MELCEKNGKQTGAVVFSERVDPGPEPGVLLAFDRAECRYLPRPVVGTPDKPDDQTTNIARFTCDTPGDVTVTWRAGAKAVSGVGMVPEVRLALARATMEKMGDFCWRSVLGI